MERYDDAEKRYKEALQIRDEISGPGHIETILMRSNLAELYSASGRYGEAEPLLRDCERICRQNGAPLSRCASALSNLGALDEKSGRTAEAEAHYREAIAIFDRLESGNDPVLAASLNNLGKLLVFEKKFREAKLVFDRALQIWQNTRGAAHPDYASTLQNLGTMLLAQKDYPAASEVLRHALEIDEKALGPNHVKLIVDLSNLAALAVQRKQFEEADALLQRSLAISRRQSGTETQAARTLGVLGNLAVSRKDYAQAVNYYAEAFGIWDKLPRGGESQDLVTLDAYIRALRQTEDYAGAEKMASRAMRLRVRAAIKKNSLR